MYIIDENLAVYSPRYQLANAKTLEYLKQVGQGSEKGSIQGETDSPIPVSLDGLLKAGELYESSSDPAVRYYLPHYQLRQVNQQFTTSLKWRSPQDDPNGALAWLLIELTPEVPQSTAVLQEIQHQAVVRIAYQLPVEGQPVGDRWAGAWTNIDPNTSGMTRLDITKTDSGWAFHGFGKCHPTDCDWGIIAAHDNAGTLQGTYDFGWKRTSVTATLSNNQLKVTTFDDYTDADGRTDRTDQFVMQQAQNSASLTLEVGALEVVSAEVRRCRLALNSKEEFDRVFQIMTDDRFQARLQIDCFAQIGHRTWRQIVSDRVDLSSRSLALSEKQVLVTDMVDENNLELVNPDRSQASVKTRYIKKAPIDQVKVVGVDRQVEPTQLERVSKVDMARIVSRSPALESRVNLKSVGVARLNASPLAATRVNRADADTIVLQPETSRVYARSLPEVLQKTDLSISARGVKEAVVPIRAMVDRRGQPALLRVPVQTTQEVPFFFVKETNAYMFSMPGDWQPSATHILLKTSIQRNGKSYKFYQDSAFREQFYFEPEEFRLSRQSEPPYLPDLRIALFDAAAAGTDPNSPEVYYRAVLTYKALPYLDSQVIEQAKLELATNASQARFTSLEPSSTKLFLQLPSDSANGTRQSIEQTVNQLTFDQGIIDEIELSATELKRVRIDLTSGLGLMGLVEANLIDSSKATIQVRLAIDTDKSQDEDFWKNLVIYQGFKKDTFQLNVLTDSSYFDSTPEGMQLLTGLSIEFEGGEFVTLTRELLKQPVTLKIPPIAWLLDKPNAKQYRYRVINLHGETAGQMTDWQSGEGELDLSVNPA